jgi:hypothetical protein
MRKSICAWSSRRYGSHLKVFESPTPPKKRGRKLSELVKQSLRLCQFRQSFMPSDFLRHFTADESVGLASQDQHGHERLPAWHGVTPGAA